MSIIDALRKLGPKAARDQQADGQVALEVPVHEESGPSPEHECRVCGWVGLEPEFCPSCYAQTMRPIPKGREPRASARALRQAEPDPLTIPPEATLDLHTFKPREVSEVVSECIVACAARGLRCVRVVHGTGTGRLKHEIERALAREPMVERFATADARADGGGATLVTLRPPKTGA